MKKRTIPCLVLVGLAAFGFGGCQSVKTRTDQAELTRGPRFDEEGKFTDQPEVSVPLWNSKGLKPKPQDVTPVKD